MDKWIKDSKHHSTNRLNYRDGNLYSCDPLVKYYVDDKNNIQLYGEFSIDQMEALLKHMKKCSKE